MDVPDGRVGGGIQYVFAKHLASAAISRPSVGFKQIITWIYVVSIRPAKSTRDYSTTDA